MNQEPERIAARYKLPLLTAQRGGEVRQMRWEDINLDEGWWTIPRELSKNDLSHRVPLSGPVREIFRHLHAERSDDRWIFPSPTVDGPIRSNTKPNVRIRARSGVEFRPHDLRRTAASKMAGELGIDRLLLAKILNHVDGSITSIYDRYSYDKETRAALEAWSERMTEILKSRPPTTATVDVMARAQK